MRQVLKGKQVPQKVELSPVREDQRVSVVHQFVMLATSFRHAKIRVFPTR